jgi:hypothetical protein
MDIKGLEAALTQLAADGAPTISLQFKAAGALERGPGMQRWTLRANGASFENDDLVTLIYMAARATSDEMEARRKELVSETERVEKTKKRTEALYVELAGRKS